MIWLSKDTWFSLNISCEYYGLTRDGTPGDTSMGITDSKLFFNNNNQAAMVWSRERQSEKVDISFNWSGKHCLSASRAL